MHCTNCGQQIPDTASICPNCGRQVQRFAPPPPSTAAPATPSGAAPVQNYLIPAILVTFCCCMPAGIVAIVYAAQVNGKLATGDMAGALDYAKKAKMWSMIGAGAGLIFSAIYLAMMGLGMVNA